MRAIKFALVSISILLPFKDDVRHRVNGVTRASTAQAAAGNAFCRHDKLAEFPEAPLVISFLTLLAFPPQRPRLLF